MKGIAVLLVLAIAVAIAAPAHAACYSNGKQVPDGTRIGPTVCVNGAWVHQP